MRSPRGSTAHRSSQGASSTENLAFRATPSHRLGPASSRAARPHRRFAPASGRVAPASPGVARTSRRFAPASPRVAPASRRLACAFPRFALASPGFAPASRRVAPRPIPHHRSGAALPAASPEPPPRTLPACTSIAPRLHLGRHPPPQILAAYGGRDKGATKAPWRCSVVPICLLHNGIDDADDRRRLRCWFAVFPSAHPQSAQSIVYPHRSKRFAS